MICPLCGSETMCTIVCSECRHYMLSESYKLMDMFSSKKREGIFYLTIAAEGKHQKTITIERSATIKIDGMHRFLEILSSIDGTPNTTKVDVSDSSISRSDELVIAEDGGAVRIMQSPSYYCLNGEEIGSDRPALKEGDVINMSNITYIKFDTDITRPAVTRGLMSLLPDGFEVGEYCFEHDGKLFFDGIRKEAMGCMMVDVKEMEPSGKKRINQWILGRMRYREMTGGR